MQTNTCAVDNGFHAKIIRDSVTEFGSRLTTMEIKYPRFIHSEILTHRDRARNSASSRAIPWPKMMEKIQDEPVVPIRWGSEQKGMQTGGEIDNPEEATRICLEMRDFCLEGAKRLAALGVHKSLVNRYTEPWMWITVVMTATNWKNLFRLRVHPDAEIHFQKIAGMMQDVLSQSTPQTVEFGGWHLPYVSDDEMRADNENDVVGQWTVDPVVDWRKVSVARCARVSYLTQDGLRSTDQDIQLFDRLCQGSGFGHWSPHEHVATPATPDVTSGPYRGWMQFRKFFINECASERS